jgi:hypothetical protein
MVYKFRVILDAEEDIFRDIAISLMTHFRRFYINSILWIWWYGSGFTSILAMKLESRRWNFAFDKSVLQKNMKATIYLIFWWRKHEDIVYDFINMWTFLVELPRLKSKKQGNLSWNLVSHGEMPDEAMEKTLKQKCWWLCQWLWRWFDEDDLDMFEGERFWDYGLKKIGIKIV